MAGGRYFNVVANYSTTNSTSEKTMNVESQYRNLICSILSTNLFWFYQQVYTDGLNLKTKDLEYFPLPDFSTVSKEVIKQIEVKYAEYLKDIEKNAINRSTYKEYKLRKSKHLIDKIDDLICPLYGLNKEEIDFIKNYEIEFRMEMEDEE